MGTKITSSTVDRAVAAAKKGVKALDISDATVGGLQLRIRRRRATWTVRCRLHDKQRRFELGTAISGPVDTEEGICLATARDWAMKIKYLCRPKAPPTDPNKHLAAWRAGTTLERMEKQLPPPEVKQPPSISWEEAKKSFLAEVERKNAVTSLKDYKGKLNVPELNRFNGKPVSGITIELMSEAIAAIHARGVEPMGLKAPRASSAPCGRI